MAPLFVFLVLFVVPVFFLRLSSLLFLLPLLAPVLVSLVLMLVLVFVFMLPFLRFQLLSPEGR